MQKNNLRILHLVFFIIIIGLISVKKKPQKLFTYNVKSKVKVNTKKWNQIVVMNQKVDLKISYILLLSQYMWSLWSISYNI